MRISVKMNSVATRALLVLLTLLVGIVILQSATTESMRRLDIVASAATPGTLQVYYDTGNGFNETQSGKVKVETARTILSVNVPASGIRKLRFDPSQEQAWLHLHAIRFAGPFGEEHLALPDLRPGKNIAWLGNKDGYTEVRMTGGIDPQLILDLDDSADTSGRLASMIPPWLWHAAPGLLWLLALSAIAIGCSNRQRPIPNTLPWMLAIASALVLSMAFATSTERSVHPDEFTHVRAAGYYLSHWLPAAVGDPTMASTYDRSWGISYLNNWDVVYFLAAKCTGLWQVITGDPVVALRLFNVLLLVSLAAFAFLRREFAAALSVLALTPQAWYVFAYFNGDAFPLFLSMLAAALVATDGNTVSRFIREGGKPTWHLALFAVTIGLLLVSKRNYLVVVFFIGMLLTWRHLRPPVFAVVAGFLGVALAMVKASSLGALGDLWPTLDKALVLGAAVLLGVFVASLAFAFIREGAVRPAFKRLTLVFLLAGAVAIPRIAVDLWINGSPGEKSEQRTAAAEKYAGVEFKPSTIQNDIDSAHSSLRYARRGVSLPEMLWERPRAWIETSWRRFFGVYGYFDVRTPAAMYWLLTLGALVVIGRVLVHSLSNRHLAGTAWIGLGSVALVVISAISFSWFYAYQAQGRYLFGCIPILGAIVAASVAGGLKSRVVPAALIMCFIVSALSFVVATGKIP